MLVRTRCRAGRTPSVASAIAVRHWLTGGQRNTPLCLPARLVAPRAARPATAGRAPRDQRDRPVQRKPVRPVRQTRQPGERAPSASSLVPSDRGAATSPHRMSHKALAGTPPARQRRKRRRRQEKADVEKTLPSQIATQAIDGFDTTVSASKNKNMLTDDYREMMCQLAHAGPRVCGLSISTVWSVSGRRSGNYATQHNVSTQRRTPANITNWVGSVPPGAVGRIVWRAAWQVPGLRGMTKPTFRQLHWQANVAGRMDFSRRDAAHALSYGINRRAEPTRRSALDAVPGLSSVFVPPCCQTDSRTAPAHSVPLKRAGAHGEIHRRRRGKTNRRRIHPAGCRRQSTPGPSVTA